jgi:hypothetical protein
MPRKARRGSSRRKGLRGITVIIDLNLFFPLVPAAGVPAALSNIYYSLVQVVLIVGLNWARALAFSISSFLFQSCSCPWSGSFFRGLSFIFGLCLCFVACGLFKKGVQVHR